MLEDIYGIASSSTKRRILLSLAQCEKGFSDLMRSVAMDPEHDTGPFLYHSLGQKFYVPALSFTTVLATCGITVHESGLRSPIMVSAGFEMD